MNLTLVSDATPDQEPVSVKEAQAYLRMDSDADNDQIQTMITAARLEAENEQARELSRKQWKIVFDRFPVSCAWLLSTQFDGQQGNRIFTFAAGSDRIELLDPLVTVDSFTYKKWDGAVVTLTENTDYIVDVDKHPGVVCPAYGTSWPTDELWPSSAVQITFTAGATPDTSPSTIKQGILLLTSQWYEGRIPFEAIRFVAELPYSVTSLFRNGKLWRF